MSRTLTIEVPDDVYNPLAAEAERTGKTVAEVAAKRLIGEAVKPDSLLRKWAGSADSDTKSEDAAASVPAPLKPGEGLKRICGMIDSDLTDVSSRVDDYLAETYLEELTGKKHE